MLPQTLPFNILHKTFVNVKRFLKLPCYKYYLVKLTSKIKESK